jgi:alpha-L-rhamnosidase
MTFQDHGARFITSTAPSGREGDPALYFRRTFHLTEELRRATLRITAVGVVEARINGTVVGDEVLGPGWTSYRNRLIVSTHDITDLMVPGENALGAIVGEGWALGRLGWENKRNHYSDRGGVYFELALETPQGMEYIVSDTAVRAGTGGLRANSIYDGEEYDATLEPAGWDSPGFDDTGWGSVEVLDWPLESLAEPIAEPIRRIEELSPVGVITTPAGRSVLDFGQNISGRVRFTVNGPAGTTVVLRHAEVMTGGEMDYETIRRAKATDRYTLAGNGPETWEPRFTFHGFRYVDVEGWPGDLEAADIVAVVTHTDMQRTGWLETSNPLLNQLHSNAVWSMRDNFVGVPTDCPQRDERLGWTGDLNAFGPTAAFLYDVRGVLGSWLTDLAIEQRISGNVPWVVPDVLPNASSPTALWSDVAVSLPWTLYREYGDENILAASYESMTSFIRQVAGLLDENGLWSKGFQYGDWLDPDAPMDNPAGGKTDRHLVAAAYLCRTTREMAQTAKILGRTSEAEEFSALAEKVRAAFRREYVAPSGRVVNETATAYALAITFDILTPEEKTHAGNQLAAIVAKAGYHISTGFAGTPLVTDALSSTGHLDEAYLLLTETGCPSFLYPVTMGATTIWERWDSVRPDGTINPSGMTSLNHYALGAVVDWMHRTIGGLTADAPGYKSMRIAPRIGGGLTHATLRHSTTHGEVSVAWQLEDNRINLNVSIPTGTTAIVELPLHPDNGAEQIEAGEHQWSYERIIAEQPDFTMDTPLGVLAGTPAIWRRVSAVFAEHLPGIPIDGTAPEAAAMSLNNLVGYIPGASQALIDDLTTAVTATEGAHA